jgi:hypothetical protein
MAGNIILKVDKTYINHIIHVTHVRQTNLNILPGTYHVHRPGQSPGDQGEIETKFGNEGREQDQGSELAPGRGHEDSPPESPDGSTETLGVRYGVYINKRLKLTKKN